MKDIAGLLEDVGCEMERRANARGGFSSLRERTDLEPVFTAALDERYRGLAEKDRKIDVPDWPRAGNVDAIVRAAPESSALIAVFELKWATRGQLYEAIWDLFKMALAAGRLDVDAAFLATAAPAKRWASDPCSDLFDDATHKTEALCSRRFANRNKRMMWDDLLEGGYDRFPAWTPSSIETRQVGRVAMRSAGEEWELRMVRVLKPSSPRRVFIEGWPGKRPDDARNPVRNAP